MERKKIESTKWKTYTKFWLWKTYPSSINVSTEKVAFLKDFLNAISLHQFWYVPNVLLKSNGDKFLYQVMFQKIKILI